MGAVAPDKKFFVGHSAGRLIGNWIGGCWWEKIGFHFLRHLITPTELSRWNYSMLPKLIEQLSPIAIARGVMPPTLLTLILAANRLDLGHSLFVTVFFDFGRQPGAHDL